MKENLDRSESNSIILKDEIHNLREQLLAWLDRCQQVKTKKANFKIENKYLVATNQEILKREKRYKMEIVKLRDKLFESRQVIKLQITT